MEVLEWKSLNFAENVFSEFLVHRIPFAPSMAVKNHLSERHGGLESLTMCFCLFDCLFVPTTPLSF